MIKTFPDLSYESHIDRLLRSLQVYFPELELDMLLFYDMKISHNNMISYKDLMSFLEFETYFLHLLREAREWINLSGDSWYKQNFIVSVDYSKKMNMPMTAINISGPTIDLEGNPVKKTILNVNENTS
jgi:hypothetical protein